ncbi:hypothetical protein PRIPAC_94102 [Pristionchus pacificus]|uniref:Uncharacterized protein n=1 Tax=Pristionchus pacificus TaxID=54126 RepID=A0A2A6CDU9_PRIPA|nr:hypothetical protein PRIPAC_94102 [Pristionchus pacificus]|eukprot:PDM76258.1 hypothetical protein PRIPAC_39862 [Pristionchus pacificus]
MSSTEIHNIIPFTAVNPRRLIKDHNTCTIRPVLLSSSFSFGNMFVGSVVVDAQFREFWREVGYPLDDGSTEMANTSPWEARCMKLFQNIQNHQ